MYSTVSSGVIHLKISHYQKEIMPCKTVAEARELMRKHNAKLRRKKERETKQMEKRYPAEAIRQYILKQNDYYHHNQKRAAYKWLSKARLVFSQMSERKQRQLSQDLLYTLDTGIPIDVILPMEKKEKEQKVPEKPRPPGPKPDRPRPPAPKPDRPRSEPDIEDRTAQLALLTLLSNDPKPPKK